MSSLNSVVDAVRPASSVPQGARHRCRLQALWWTLLDPPAAPPGGPPLTSSSNSVEDPAGPTNSAPRRPAIDVFFKTQWWTLPDPSAAPQGARHRRHAASGSRCQYPLSMPPRGPLVDYHYLACYKQDNSREIFLDPCDAKDSI
jgi:hypothetical protein